MSAVDLDIFFASVRIRDGVAVLVQISETDGRRVFLVFDQLGHCHLQAHLALGGIVSLWHRQQLAGTKFVD